MLGTPITPITDPALEPLGTKGHAMTTLTINTISEAMKGNAFWLDAGSDAARIVAEATRRGFIRRASHTQVEWTDAGLEKARAELATPAAAKALVTLNIATALKEAGVDVVKADLGQLGFRVDVRGKASAAMAAELLSKAGLCEVRALSEGRGLWLVVGRLAA